MEEKNMAQITTNSGFTCSIDRNNLDDMRILDALVDVQQGDAVKKLTGVKTLLERILGEEQKEQLYTHLEDKFGRAGTVLVRNEIIEIFNKLGEAGKK